MIKENLENLERLDGLEGLDAVNNPEKEENAGNAETAEQIKKEPWQNDGTADEKAMTWIWNQLMGETAKGDTLEFAALVKQIPGGEERLYAGLLKDRSGKLKTVVPAMYDQFVDGVLKVVEFDGRTREEDMDSLTPELKIGKMDVDIDGIGRGFLF